METFAKFAVPGMIFLLTIGSGLWLSSIGKPYQVSLFNVHKLIALGMVVVTVIQAVKILKTVDVHTLLVAALIAAAAGALALFATGALLSIGKVSYQPLRAVHIAAAVVMPLALVGAVWLL